MIIQILGPTASGKTSFSIKLAKALQTEIVNVDSMQVYTDLAIGTDKPTPQQCNEVTFHAINLIPLGPPLDAATFANIAHKHIKDIHDKNAIPIISGGTALYHKAIRFGLLQAPSRDDDFRNQLRKKRDELGTPALHDELARLDPKAAENIHENDYIRIERALEVFATAGLKISQLQDNHRFQREIYRTFSIATYKPRPQLYEDINERLKEMWNTGLLEETQKLLDLNLDPNQLPLKALGYKQAALYLTGKLSSNEALELAQKQTRRFAKRQLTWFRTDPKILWIQQPIDDRLFQNLITAINQFTSFSNPDLSAFPKITP